ncbi:hypothetical protein GCM10007920_07350 [Ciceribacter naphthalenivorans]|nr:hypothetical protein GCM10007920_07350 [Ciceribacter naphthalenivorans]GLT03806.1 hypothetical protein GCM10007926_07350 [Sphingomonas psychrolutea]
MLYGARLGVGSLGLVLDGERAEVPRRPIRCARADFVNVSGAFYRSTELKTEDMSAAIMEASTKPVEGATRTALAPADPRSVIEDSAAGDIFSQWLGQDATSTLQLAGDIRWDEADDQDFSGEPEKRYVPATWLDALGHDHAEQPADSSSEISAVNSDDNGLYRMFRNVSP